LKLEIKNVPELVIKIFEINLETYYKKNLTKFDPSINLDGMVPSIERVEAECFKGIPANKITSIDFTLHELKDKRGLFVIEM
jgi:hypothetical protein